jgi:AraC-like DNA-binding protein
LRQGIGESLKDFSFAYVLLLRRSIMRSFRDEVGVWPTLARRANYSTTALAGLCGISLRQLERNFRRAFCQSPKKWLKALRLRSAREMLQSGGSVKEVAFSLGYRHPQHFSRDFRKFFGVSPSLVHRAEMICHLVHE